MDQLGEVDAESYVGPQYLAMGFAVYTLEVAFIHP